MPDEQLDADDQAVLEHDDEREIWASQLGRELDAILEAARRRP